MSKSLKFAFVFAVSALTVAALALIAWHRFDSWAVENHQRATTRELASWEQDFSHIRNKEEAIRAVDMLRYIQDYYVPGPGYRSDSTTESALQAQRQKTVSTIARALEQFTGERYGEDVDKWEAWRDGQRRQ